MSYDRVALLSDEVFNPHSGLSFGSFRRRLGVSIENRWERAPSGSRRKQNGVRQPGAEDGRSKAAARADDSSTGDKNKTKKP